jgi:murein DD-endopeptidase MepM/ murein hydrolase activator NlpD
MGFFGRHLGVDYATPVGTPVKSPCHATVIETGYSGSVGLYIILKEDGNGRIHRLLHLNSEAVSVGQHVSEGQLIGASGQTGTNITGPHLHWDVRRANTTWNASFDNYSNPESLVAQAAPKPDSNVTPDDVGKTIYLSPKVSAWKVYRIGTTAQVATLNPKKFGGLAYRILGIDTFRPQRVIIQTSYYGRVALPVDTDAEIR